jgi:hypothetical protein
MIRSLRRRFLAAAILGSIIALSACSTSKLGPSAPARSGVIPGPCNDCDLWDWGNESDRAERDSPKVAYAMQLELASDARDCALQRDAAPPEQPRPYRACMKGKGWRLISSGARWGNPDVPHVPIPPPNFRFYYHSDVTDRCLAQKQPTCP